MAVRARPPRNPDVTVEVGFGHAVPAELVGLGLDVPGGGSLGTLPAGLNVAVGCHAGTTSLRYGFRNGTRQ